MKWCQKLIPSMNSINALLVLSRMSSCSFLLFLFSPEHFKCTHLSLSLKKERMKEVIFKGNKMRWCQKFLPFQFISSSTPSAVHWLKSRHHHVAPPVNILALSALRGGLGLSSPWQPDDSRRIRASRWMPFSISLIKNETKEGIRDEVWRMMYSMYSMNARESA